MNEVISTETFCKVIAYTVVYGVIIVWLVACWWDNNNN